MIQGLIHGRGKIIFLPMNIHTGCGAHPASYSMDNGVPSAHLSGCGTKLITHLHPVLKLRILGAIPLLHDMHRDNLSLHL